MADTSFDVVIIGSGPGGYVAAIRAAQLGLQDRDRREGLSRRHLPELGLHPDQGAAALGRNLPLHAACEGLRAFRRQRLVRCEGGGAALARRLEAAERRRRLPDAQEQGAGDLGRGGDRRARKIHREGVEDRGAEGRAGCRRLSGETHRACDRRPAARAAGPRGRRQAGVDLFRGDDPRADSEVAAGGRLRRDRRRVRIVLPHHGRGRDHRRGAAADTARRGRRGRGLRPQEFREAGHQDPHRRQGDETRQEERQRGRDHRRRARARRRRWRSSG